MRNLDNALQGHLTAAVFEVLLVDAGYHVVPLGIERSARELRAVDAAAYAELVHPRLRSIPDLFVLDLAARRSWLTEIKLRRYVHALLHDDLRRIQEAWAPFTLILAVAEPLPEWTGTIRHLRVFQIDRDTRIDGDLLTHGAERLQDVFPRLADRWQDGTIQKAQEAILRIVVEE